MQTIVCTEAMKGPDFFNHFKELLRVPPVCLGTRKKVVSFSGITNCF